MMYEIVDFNSVNGVITVAYEDGLTINVDLPIIKEHYPVGDELHNIILNMYPNHYAARIKEVKSVINADSIKKLVSVKIASDHVEPEIVSMDETTNELDKEAIFAEGVSEIVINILKKNNLL